MISVVAFWQREIFEPKAVNHWMNRKVLKRSRLFASVD